MWKNWAQRLEEFADLQIPVYAANACYFLAISIFPALLLILASLRYTALSAVDLIRLLEGILPGALMGAAESLIVSTYYNSSAGLVGVSALAALWSASRGIHGLLAGLNRIYGVREDRGWLCTRLICVGYTFVFLLLVLLTLVLHVFGTTLLNILSASELPFLRFLTAVVDLRFFVLLAIQTALFTAMFMVFPNRRNKAADSLPGALLASIGWLTFSDIFSIYVENFTRYSNIYGSVYAVALSMLWLYFCISIFFYGGALNHALMRREKQEKE